MMGRRTCTVLLAGVVLPVLLGASHAAQCSMEYATYREPDAGFTLQFRPMEVPRDPMGMTTAVFEVTREGEDWVLPGVVSTNMGINRDEARAYLNCEKDPEYGGFIFTDDCKVWDGLIYALGERTADFMPMSEEPAAEVLLLTDFGRQIRYQGPADGPGDAPWDVFTLVGCTEP
jgi:hypothetical protein